MIGNEDDTDIVNINDEESEPLGDDETSSADGCTAGPTVHFHQEKWIEKIIMERKTMFGEMAGAGVCDLEDDVFDGPGRDFIFDYGYFCRKWSKNIDFVLTVILE